MDFDPFMLVVRSSIKSISAADARKCLEKDPKTVFIDVRDSASYAKAHIPNAVHMERGMLEFYLTENSPCERKPYSQKRDDFYIVYCDKGGQSALSVQTMQSLGFSNVHNLSGGITAWHADEA